MPIKEQPQSKKQHAVPQNIMDVEFKLIGDLTMRQFFYVMIFSAISYVAYMLKIPIIIKWAIIATCIPLGLGFAFMPIEDRGLDEWIINFFRATYEETQKVWKKRPELLGAFLYNSLSMVKHELITLAPTSSRRRLERYLEGSQEDIQEDPLDIPEQAFIEKIHKAFVKTAPAAAPVVTEVKPIITTHAPPQPPVKKTPTREPPKKAVEKEPGVPVQKIQKKKPVVKKPKRPVPLIPDTTPLIPITPNRLSGRKFTNLLSGQGDIVLPIRGERVIPLSSERAEDASEKADKLKELLNQIRTEEKQEETKAQEKVQTRKPKQAAEPIKTDMPNVVSGVVKNISGRGLSNVTLVIKNERGDPVRAMKTNTLGQFIISNPLQIGKYKVSADVNNTTGYAFDIIGLEAKGEKMPPIVLVGK